MAREKKFTFYERLVERWPLVVLGLFLCFGLEVLFRWNVIARGISILGEVRNVEISRVTQQLLCSKF